MPAARKYASGTPTRMSQQAARHSPPPMAGPLMAAMTGWCISRMPSTTSSSSLPARWAIVVGVSPSMWGMEPDVFWSAPEQKPSPAPVMMTTRVSLSLATASSCSLKGSMTSNAMAFMRSGRFNVMTVTCGTGFSTMTKDTRFPPEWFGSRAP